MEKPESSIDEVAILQYSPENAGESEGEHSPVWTNSAGLPVGRRNLHYCLPDNGHKILPAQISNRGAEDHEACLALWEAVLRIPDE